MEALVHSYIAQFTYMGIFAFLMLTVFGFPFPEDAVLLLSGAVVSSGATRMLPTLYIAYTGVIIGDLILYYMGRKYGRMLVAHPRFGRVLTENRMRRAGKWFHRWGNSLIFFGRHLVGVRAQIFLCAGVFRLPARRVLAYDGLSALIGVPLMVWLGFYFGHRLPEVRERVALWHWVFAALVIVFIAVIWGISVYKNKKQIPGFPPPRE